MAKYVWVRRTMKKPKSERAQRGHQRRGAQRGEHRPPRLLGQDRRGVGAEREVGGVPEGDHAAEAHEEVEGGGEEGDDRDLDEEDDEERRQDQREGEGGDEGEAPGDRPAVHRAIPPGGRGGPRGAR